MRSKRTALLGALIAFLGLFAITGAFSLLTPLSASPDEPDHWRQAYAVWSGQASLVGTPDPGEPSTTGNYMIPEYMQGYLAQCTYQQSTVTADCALSTGGSELVAGGSSAYAYPPAFYLATGWVARLLDGTPALYGMRLASGAAFAAIVAMTVGLLRQAGAGWRAHFALLLGLTPAICFLAGTMNPSSMAVAAIGLLVVVQWRWFLAAGTRHQWFWFAAVVGAGVLAASIRPLSGLLAGVAVLATALATFPPSHWRAYWWRVGIVLVVVALFVVGRLFTQVGAAGVGGSASASGSYLTPVTAVWSSLWKGLSLPGKWVGLMGWLDAGENAISTAAWFAAIGLVVLAAMDRGGRRRILAAQLVLVFLVIMWLYIDTVYTRSSGKPFWQARYGAPLVLIALLMIPMARRPQALIARMHWRAVLATALMTVSFVAAATLMLVRYAWGADWQGPMGQPAWLPLGGSFIGTLALLVLLALGVVVACLGPISLRESGAGAGDLMSDPAQEGPTDEGVATDIRTAAERTAGIDDVGPSASPTQGGAKV